MKNLKKVLALVLVVATLMGLATVAGAKFSDDASIQYKEAVDVMTGIGVINGYPNDNTFRPTANVKRAEMAKMITYIVSGGEDVGNLYAGANSFSDCTTHWAKGYIAYATKTGILAGVGNGLFKPESSVTGTQAAKMLLCALGYDAGAEGYTGTSWAVNTLADAKSVGLLKGLNNVDMSAALSREAAAQMMFNALKADMVEYDRGNTTITSGDSTIVIGGSAAKKVENNDFDYRTVNGDKDKVMQLCENYFEDLTCKATGSDSFGRPGNEWKYGKDTIGTYGSSADYIFVLDEDYSAKADLLTALKDLVDDDDLTMAKDASLYLNGVADTEANVKAAAKIGTVLEVYTNDDDEVTSVIAYYYTLGKVEEVDTDVTSGDEKDGISAYVTIDGATYDDVDVAGFDANTYVEDTYVAYIENDKAEIIDSYVAESVSGSVSTKKNNEYVTVDGTKYYAAAASLTNLGSVTVGADTEYTLYLDANGYVIGFNEVEGTSTIKDVYYVVDDFTGNDGYGNATYFVQLVSLNDGSVNEIQLEQAMSKYSVASNDLVTISDKKNGDFKANNDKYDLTKWADKDYDTDLAVKAGAKFTKTATKIAENDVTVRLNSSTQYVMVEGTLGDLSASLKTSGISYTVAAADKVTVITEDGKNVALYVIISGADTSESVDFDSKNVLYIDSESTEKGDGYRNQEVYFADGTKETVTMDEGAYPLTAGFYTYAENADGNYELDDPAKLDFTGTWDDESGVVLNATFNELYETLLTVTKDGKKMVDIETKDAKFIDLHDTDAEYDRSISSLSRLSDLIGDGKVKAATLSLNVSSTGAVTIVLTSATVK